MAVRTSLMEFQVPRIVHEEVEDTRGVFVIEPLDRGFGYTFGNSLRRVLLSSLEGAAVTSVKIEGVAHEFTTLPGVREDVTDILLNFKSLICRLHGESPEIEVRLSKKGAGAVKASDIEAPAELEILNPDLEIANLSDKGKLEVTLTIGRGRGYVPAELNRGPEHTIGVIPIDSIFSPVRRVSYDVEAARVGQRTDYDKLRIDVTTDGSIDPRESIGQAAEILIRQLAIFTDLDRIEGFGEQAACRDPGRAARSRTGWRTSRSRSSSSACARTTASSASASRRSATSSTKTENELAAIPNFGKKSIEEVKETLGTHGLTLRGERRRLRREAPAVRQEARPRRLAPQGALREPRERADRARADQDDRRQGEGGQADRRADDHARRAAATSTRGGRRSLPALAGRRAQALQRRRAALRRPARAATRRIVRIGPRQGDAAEMVYLELVDYMPEATFAAWRQRARREEPSPKPSQAADAERRALTTRRCTSRRPAPTDSPDASDRAKLVWKNRQRR